MGLFRGAVLHQPKTYPLALMGRFPLLNGPSSDHQKRPFPECLNGTSSFAKIPQKTALSQEKGHEEVLKIHRQATQIDGD